MRAINKAKRFAGAAGVARQQIAHHAPRRDKPRPVARLAEAARSIQLFGRKQCREEGRVANVAIYLPCPEVNRPRAKVKPVRQLQCPRCKVHRQRFRLSAALQNTCPQIGLGKNGRLVAGSDGQLIPPRCC